MADEDSAPTELRRARLTEWRRDIQLACTGGAPQFPVNQELQPVIREYGLPFELFDELIQGCEMDLEIKAYDNYEQLEAYCHRVASVVGLLSIRIFGCKNPAAGDYARHLGKALQLTNILRDVRADAERGRIYLPRVEMERWGVPWRPAWPVAPANFISAPAARCRRRTAAPWWRPNSWARFTGSCCSNWSATNSMFSARNASAWGRRTKPV